MPDGDPQRWLLYGAYGYSGRLIARLARDNGMHPVLAGRNAEKLEALARELSLDAMPLELYDHDKLTKVLREFNLVMHCAGPFSSTAEPVLDACLAAGTHYLDITGEIRVFEAAHRRHAAAREARIVICPGVGFDVVPTDCVAAKLRQALPDADRLALGFDSRSALSPGTAKTAIEGLAEGGRVRSAGLIREVPLAWRTRRIDFGNGEKLAMTIPWGDVATAYFSTGIPAIEVFVPASPRVVSRLRRLNYVRPLLRLGLVQGLMKRSAGKRMSGPDSRALETDRTFVWGEARNPEGHRKVARLVTANGYRVTAESAVAITKHMLGARLDGGYYTPSMLMGADFVSSLPGSGAIRIE